MHTTNNVPTALMLSLNSMGTTSMKRMELLRKIKELGTLSAAAKAVPMSYKAAWDALDAMNNMSPAPLVISEAGGKEGGKSVLTTHGHQVLAYYDVVESARQHLARLLREKLSTEQIFTTLLERFSMKTSARNQFAGTIIEIKTGAVNSSVMLQIAPQECITAIITNDSSEALSLQCGMEAVAFVKASSVLIIQNDPHLRLSASNQLCGTVVMCQKGAVNAEIKIELPSKKTVTSIITNESVDDLGIEEGKNFCACFTESSVILAVN